MENFRIIDKNEIANNVTLINASKKLKTRSHDFGNIKKNNISKSQEPVFKPSIKKEEQPIMNTQSINNDSYQKEEVKPNNLYGAMKEEQIINLQHIRDLENTYKGHGSIPKSPKEEVKPATTPAKKEEKHEEKIYCVDGGKTHIYGDGANEHGYYKTWDEAFKAYEDYTRGWDSTQFKVDQCACGLYYFWVIK